MYIKQRQDSRQRLSTNQNKKTGKQVIKKQHERTREIFTSFKHKDEFKIMCNDYNNDSFHSSLKTILKIPKTEVDLIKKYS